jgi:hypothetical protein
MGIWSSIKKVAKKIWRGVKTVVRIGLKGLFGLIFRIFHGLGEIFFFWVKKKFRIQAFVFRDETGKPLVTPESLDPAIQRAREIFEQEFKVKIRFYSEPGVTVLPDPAPTAALDIHCNDGAVGEEFGEAGEYFADNLAGWVGIPISFRFPVTIFVIRKFFDNKIGCSHRWTDYVTLDAKYGVKELRTLAHELGHTCLLRHRRDDETNLMWPGTSGGTSTTWWQRRVVRTSRHCTFW